MHFVSGFSSSLRVFSDRFHTFTVLVLGVFFAVFCISNVICKSVISMPSPPALPTCSLYTRSNSIAIGFPVKFQQALIDQVLFRHVNQFKFSGHETIPRNITASEFAG